MLVLSSPTLMMHGHTILNFCRIIFHISRNVFRS